MGGGNGGQAAMTVIWVALAVLAVGGLGAVHHLVLTNPAGLPDLPQRVGRIVAALTAGLGPAPG